MLFRRRVVIIPLALVAIILAFWSAAWFFVSARAVDAVEKWFQEEAQRGRTWDCKSGGTSGFPFKLIYRCEGATLLATSHAGKIDATLKKIEASYNPLHPRSVQIRAEGPVSISQLSGQSRNVQGHWEDLALALTISGFNAGSLMIGINGRKLQLRHKFHDQPEELLDIARFSGVATPRTNVQNMRSLRVEINAGDISAVLLERMLGVKSIAELEGILDIENVQSLTGPDNIQRLRHWRDARGKLQIEKFRVNGGRLALEADGRLEIDNAGYPTGHVSARAAGATALLQHMGAARNNAGNPGLLGRVFRGPGSESAADSAPGRMIPLPLVLRDGFVWLGPIKTPVALPHLVP